MKIICGVIRNMCLFQWFFSALTLLVVPVASAAPNNADAVVFERFESRDVLSSDPSTGTATVANGILILRDNRHGQQLTDVAPPMWTLRCAGTAPAESYLEVRVKASSDTMYWFDLVDQRNNSIATVPMQEGTGDWQVHRVRFEGQFGSRGDDLFIRVKKKDDRTAADGVQVDYVAVIKGTVAANRTAPPAFDADSDLALAAHECIVLSSSFENVGDRYTDKLIDGDARTTWRTFPAVKGPHWVELRWEYPVQIDRVTIRPGASETPSKVDVQIPCSNGWETVKTITPPSLWPTSGISEKLTTAIKTDRLRFALYSDTADVVALNEIEVYGPPQPLLWKLRPYWQAHYIWYPEPDKQIKTGARYFRRTFDIADLSEVRSAFLQARSNDGYTAFINGKQVAAGSIVIRPVDVKAALVEGRNCIVFVATAAKDPGWPLMTLLAQLNINTGNESRVVATDASWKCSTAAPEGWNLTGFNDTGWANAFICATPPDEPWGRIPYFDVSERQPIQVTKPVTISGNANESVAVEVELQTTPLPTQDLLLIAKVGEPEINSDRSNYVIATETIVLPKSVWSADGRATARLSFDLPSYAPAMSLPVRLNVLALDKSHGFSVKADSLPDDMIGTIDAKRAGAATGQQLDKGPIGAAIESENGGCRIRVGAQSYSPFLWALQTPSTGRFGAYSDTGVHLYHLQIYPYRIEPAVDYEKVHFAFIDQHIRHLLAIDPAAKVLVEMDVRDSGAWVEANPAERLITAQGKPKAASMASAKYASGVSDFTRRLVRTMESKPYRDAIIGYIPEIAEPESAMGGADENAFQIDRSKLNIGDYNPQAIAMFRQFLRDKYGNSVDALRVAWKHNAVDFDSAKPVLTELTREGEQGGVFRDPSKGRMPFDYFEFLSTMVPNFFEKNVAAVVKQETKGRALVGFYYGYVVETLRSVNNPGLLLQGNHFHFDKVIDSPNIDFFMSPLQYEHRMAGDRMFSFQPMDSLRLHKKLYIAEEDLRTSVSGLTSYGRQRSEQESDAVLKNHLGTAVIKGTGAWMADWSNGYRSSRTAVPFFEDSTLLKTVSDIKKLYDDTKRTPQTENTQIAVFVSPKTMYYHDVAYASVIYNSLISGMLYTQMPYIGAPFDTYAIEDVDKPKVQDQYKLYVFLNPYFMDDAQRAAIERLKRDGKTLLFFYAPGFISNERGLQVGDVAHVSGMKTEVSFDKQIQKSVTAQSDHPILSGVGAGMEFAVNGFDYAPETAKIHPTAFGPRFMITDEKAVPLARFADGKAALAAEDFGTWKSVYSTVPYLDAKVLRNVAAWAGVHLYTDENIVVEASRQFVLLHSGFDRDRAFTLRLPEVCGVEDALSGAPLAEATRQLEVRLPRGTTLIYRLKQQ